MVSTFSRVCGSDQPGRVASPARGQLIQGKCFFSCAHSRLRIWSRETGSSVASRVSPLLLHGLRLNHQSDWLVLTRNFSRVPRRRPHVPQPPSGQSRVNRVTQLRTDGVHCRESAGTGPIVLKVHPRYYQYPVTGCAFSGFMIFYFFIFAPLFSLTHY